MKREDGYTLLEAVVLIVVTSSIVGITTDAIVTFTRIGRAVSETSASIVGLTMLEKTLVEVAASISAPPGIVIPIKRGSADHRQPDGTTIEIPYFGGDPCSSVVVESTGRTTRVVLRDAAHEQTVVVAPVRVEFEFHAHDKGRVTFRARAMTRAAFTVRFGGPAGDPAGAPADTTPCGSSGPGAL